MKYACFLLFSFFIFAQEIVTRSNGSLVKLNSDGTWEIAETKVIRETNFRKTTWGMSQDQVKKSEPSELVHEDEELLGYKATVLGNSVHIYYLFTKNKLVRARYFIAEAHTNRNDYISDYNTFKNAYTEKYGEPLDDNTLWKNSLYKKDHEQWGFAVSIGHLVYHSKWLIDDGETDLTLMAMGENYKITVISEYVSRKLKGIEEAAKKKKNLDDL